MHDGREAAPGSPLKGRGRGKTPLFFSTVIFDATAVAPRRYAPRYYVPGLRSSRRKTRKSGGSLHRSRYDINRQDRSSSGAGIEWTGSEAEENRSLSFFFCLSGYKFSDNADRVALLRLLNGDGSSSSLFYVLLFFIFFFFNRFSTLDQTTGSWESFISW